MSSSNRRDAGLRGDERRRDRGSYSDLAQEGYHGPEAAPAHPGGHAMGRGDGTPAGQPLRPDRPRSRRAELHRPAHEGAAAPGGRVGDREGVGVGLKAGREAGIRAARADGDPLRRGPGGRVDGDRPERWGVDHPGRALEDEPRAPDSAQSPCVGDPRRGAGARSRKSAGVSELAWEALDGTAFTRLLKRLGINAVPHGFRSSFRDWAAEETDHPREVAEAALAHVVRNQVEAAYRRTDLFERRRRLMADWAEYLADEK